MDKHIFTFLVSFLICFGINAQYNDGIKVETLIKSDTTVLGQKIVYPQFQSGEVTMCKITIPAGKSTGWHKHDSPVFAYVLKGDLIVEQENGKANLFRENSCIPEVVNINHNGVNKGKKDVVLIASYLKGSGQKIADIKPLYPIEKRDEIIKNIKQPDISSNKVSILSFGAVGDSLTDCKPAFDKAMHACKEQGGARIVVPAGTYYLDGPIHLVSNVCLELQKGSRLKFSSNPASYLPAVLTSWEGTFLYNYSPFIYGYQLNNVSIIGEGVIDGNAANTFNKWADIDDVDQQKSREMNHGSTPVGERIFGEGHFLRPQLIQLFECKNILVEGVTMTDSPFWCLHLLKSENITVRKVKYHSFNKNNDGIDPEYSRNILIEDVDFDNADDNVAIKAGRDNEGWATATPSENILIRNCRFKGLHALVIGSEMSAGVQNVFVENCTYGGYLKRGIYLKSNPDRGGFIKNIYVKNVSFGEVEDCFYITSYYHGEGKGHETDINNIYIDSVTCRKATASGLVIQGYPLKKVRDIYLSNIRIDTAATGLSLTETENIVMSNVIIGNEVKVPSNAN